MKTFLFYILFLLTSIAAGQTYSVEATAGPCGQSSGCDCVQTSSTSVTDPDGAVTASIRTYNSGQNVEVRFSKPSGGPSTFLCSARIRIYEDGSFDTPLVDVNQPLRCNSTSQFDVGIPSSALPSTANQSKVYVILFDNNPTGVGIDCDGNFCGSTPCAISSDPQILLSRFTVTRAPSQNNGPDVVITDVSLENPNPIAGSDNRLQVEFNNVSNFLLTGIEVEYKIDGEVVGGDSHSNMSPGDVEDESMGFTFECPGTYEFCATISIDQIDVDPGNNTLCRTVVVTASPPQISFSGLRTVPESPFTTGEEARFYVSLQNTGGLTAENVIVSLRVNENEMRNFDLGDMPAGAGIITRNAFYTFPTDGDYEFDAFVTYNSGCSGSTEDATSDPLVVEVNGPAEFSPRLTEYIVSEPRIEADHTVNVLIAYTDQAVNDIDGAIPGDTERNLQLLRDAIGLNMIATQTTLNNSTMSVFVNAVGFINVPYLNDTDPMFSQVTIRNQLLNTTDGELDNLATEMREMYAADIVLLFVGDIAGAGIACDNNNNPGNPDNDCSLLAASVIPVTSLSQLDEILNDDPESAGRLTVTHELGHIWGCEHAFIAGVTDRGHCNSGDEERTVMARSSQTVGGVEMTCRPSLRIPVFSGPDVTYPGSGVVAGSENENCKEEIIDNMPMITSLANDQISIMNTGNGALSILESSSSASWLVIDQSIFPILIQPGELITLPFSVNWDLAGNVTNTASVTFIHSEGSNNEISITTRPVEEALDNPVTFGITSVASLVSNAEVTITRGGITELCGHTNAVGEIVCTTAPALKIGDQFQVSASGYESISVTLTEDMINDGRLSLPVIEDPNNPMPINPYLELVGDRFTSSSSVTVSAGASGNLSQTQVRSNGGGWQTISANGSIALPLVDGVNLVEAQLTGPGGSSIVTEEVFKLPASEIIDATINVPAGLEGACFYASDLLMGSLAPGINSVKMPRTAIDYVFKKKGYLDTKVQLHAPTIPYALSMTPRPDFNGSKTLSGFSSQNVQFAERGVSVKYQGNSNLTITREDASFNDPGIVPLTQTVEVLKSGSDQAPIFLKVSYDQIQEFSINDLSVLIEKNGELLEITPAEFEDSVLVDNINQVLTLTNLTGGEKITIIENASFLPVELLFFKGAIDEKGRSTLFWESMIEEDFSHYELEHSKDASHFENFGVVTGEGPRQYSATHASIVGNNFYRLRIIDLDGSYQYSNIIKLYNDGDNLTPEINIYPNPANNNINVLLPEDIIIDKVSILTVDNRIVYENARTNSSAFTAYIGDLPAGTYVVRVSSGKNLYNKKFIKN